MKLTEKEFIKADGTVVKLTPEWISTKLGEVYELSCIDKIDQERLHYGYMTEALVSFLETTDKKGVPFFERVELKSIDVGNNRICNLLNQRVILDKPSKIERENFYHDFKLWPTMYSDEKKIDDIVVKVHSEFTLCNREGDLELHFNDNLVELNVFELINSDNKKEIYHFTFEDNVASSVIISEMNQPFWSNNKALDNIDVAFEAKKEASIVLESSAINMMVDDRENFTFNPIKVGDYFALIDSQINFDRESLKNREVELDTDFFYLKNSSISFEGANKGKVGLYTRGATTLDDCEITCVDYSFINKTISTQVIGGEAQKTKVRFENATIDSGVSYYSNVKYDSSVFEIINSKIENSVDEILSLANGISITNSTVKNTLKLANVLIENADIDNLVLENKGKDHDSFLVQTSTVDGDKKSQGRITLSNCVVNVDDYFSISVHGNFSAFNSNFFGVNNFYSSLEDDRLLRIRSDVNLDINIINSNFKNAKVYAIGLLTNKEWQNPDYRQTLAIYGSELTGENELRETTLVLNSILQNATLANASEIKNSFLKEVAKNYEMPTTIEGVNLVANEPKKDVGKVNNELEIL